jgi:hypothetical protein
MTQGLLVKLDRKNGPALHTQIERELRDAIPAGRLPADTPFP